MTHGWMRLTRDPVAATAAVVIALALAAAALGPWLAPYDPLAIDLASNFQPSSWAHPLGTDHLGRDTLSRLIAGARVSLGIAVVSTAAGMTIGVTLGLIAAWRRGPIDLGVRQAADVMLTLPDMLLGVAVAMVLGRGVLATIVAVAAFSMPIFIRLVRAAVLGVVGREFVLAARASGASDTHIILRHLLPHCWSPILAQGTIMLGSAILMASGLSFLGLGVQPPDAEWGAMLTRGRELLRTAPLGAAAPGLAITATVLSFSLLGDAVRDILSPRQ